MRKFALAALAAVFATLSVAPAVNAASRDGEEWRRNGGMHRDHRDRGPRDRGWRGPGRNNWRHEGGRYHGWHGGPRWDGPRHYWGGPRVIIAPGYYPDYYEYCYVKKVRRYDQWGNLYIRRIRVCE